MSSLIEMSSQCRPKKNINASFIFCFTTRRVRVAGVECFKKCSNACSVFSTRAGLTRFMYHT